MKKFIVAVLALVMLLAVAVTANADTNYANFTIYNVPCVAIADTELYRYHGSGYVDKDTTDHIVQIKHYVEQCDADETNRIAAYRYDTGNTMGASWKPADNTYYPITSNAIKNGFRYTAAARGNTKYADDYELTNITISGRINAYDD